MEDLIRCESALRGVAARGRRVLDLRGYQAFVAESGAAPFLSLAVPLDDEAATSRAIDELVAAFAGTASPVRLEFVAELHTGLADALSARGFHLDRHDPIMTCRLDDLFVPALPSGTTYEAVTADPTVVAEFLLVQAIAFTLAPAGNGWEPIFTDGLADGAFTAGLARRRGVPIGAATLLRSGDVAELAGVGTLPDYRRQGVAAAVCGRLLATAFDRGLSLAWLSADRSGAGVYTRLGFRTVGTQLNFVANAASGRKH